MVEMHAIEWMCHNLFSLRTVVDIQIVFFFLSYSMLHLTSI